MLQIEMLEQRDVCSTVSLLGGTLVVTGDNQANVLNVQTNPADATQIQVFTDGMLQTFQAAQVQRVVIDGQGGNDLLTSRVTGVPDVLLGGDGNDSLQAFGTSTVALGGNGNDQIYAIVGTGSYSDGGSGQDDQIGNATTTFVNDAADRPNVVFGQTIQGGFQLINGVLLFQGTANADVLQIDQQGNTLTVTYNGVTGTFAANTVDRVAGIFLGGDDRIVNASSVDAVFYGAAGNDTLIGGSGNDLLKGGAGNDFISGNQGQDDLTGDAGVDTVIGGQGNDILRLDAADVFFLVDRQDRVNVF